MAHRLATLVTGASSGIGAALAASFAREPSRVLILVARRTAPMHALADELKTRYGTESQVIEADLEVPGAATKLLAQIDQLGLSVDTLINNAGFGLNGPLHEMTLARVSGMLQLNITALTELTHGVLPAMRARRSGRILNVASIAAFQPCPNFAAYGASKAYVMSFSEALAIEVETSGITVTAGCPGSTTSGFHTVAGSDRALVAKFMDSPETVAAQAYKALQNGERVIVTGWVNKPLPMMSRIMPRTMLARITGKLMAK